MLPQNHQKRKPPFVKSFRKGKEDKLKFNPVGGGAAILPPGGRWIAEGETDEERR